MARVRFLRDFDYRPPVFGVTIAYRGWPNLNGQTRLCRPGDCRKGGRHREDAAIGVKGRRR